MIESDLDMLKDKNKKKNTNIRATLQMMFKSKIKA